MRVSLGCHTRRSTIRGMSDHPSASCASASCASASCASASCGRGSRPGGSYHSDPERGALSLMLVVMFVVLAALAGIVVDGGAKLTADENAVALAQEAGRAGATTVNVSSA